MKRITVHYLDGSTETFIGNFSVDDHVMEIRTTVRTIVIPMGGIQRYDYTDSSVGRD